MLLLIKSDICDGVFKIHSVREADGFFYQLLQPRCEFQVVFIPVGFVLGYEKTNSRKRTSGYKSFAIISIYTKKYVITFFKNCVGISLKYIYQYVNLYQK